MWEVNLQRLFLTVFDQTRKLITGRDERGGLSVASAGSVSLMKTSDCTEKKTHPLQKKKKEKKENLRMMITAPNDSWLLRACVCVIACMCVVLCELCCWSGRRVSPVPSILSSTWTSFASRVCGAVCSSLLWCLRWSSSAFCLGPKDLPPTPASKLPSPLPSRSEASSFVEQRFW